MIHSTIGVSPSPLQPNALLPRKYQSGEGAGGEAESLQFLRLCVFALSFFGLALGEKAASLVYSYKFINFSKPYLFCYSIYVRLHV